jgi:hypothetical protein
VSTVRLRWFSGKLSRRERAKSQSGRRTMQQKEAHRSNQNRVVSALRICQALSAEVEMLNRKESKIWLS